MKLLCLYGPPAVGKLTVARELGARTGFPVFHNHLVVDMLTPVFDFGSLPFVDIREMAMLAVIGHAAGEGMAGLIFTFTPESTVTPGFIGQLAAVVTAAGGEPIFVRLTCPEKTLEGRMENESRARYGKINSVAQYRRIREMGMFAYPPIPNTRLTIDTSVTQPHEAAEAIIERFKLPSAA